MSIKLVAIDLDDTLLNSDRRISPRAKKAIRRAVAQGVTVTLATGRMPRSALPYAVELELAVPLITYNGALIRHSLSGETLFHRPIDAKTAAEVLTLFKRRNWYIHVYLDDFIYVKERSEKVRAYESYFGVSTEPVGDELYSLAGTPTKMLAVAETAELNKVNGTLRELFVDRLYVTSSRFNYLELVDPGANKGLALAYLAQTLGLTRAEVMAVGDSQNDVDMIEYAGLGVAMANAGAEVKAKADAQTSANDADGVAEAIEKYVL